MITSRSIRVAVNGIISFFQWLSSTPLYLCATSLSVRRWTARRLRVLAVTDGAAVTGLQVSFWTMTFLEMCSGVGLPGRVVTLMCSVVADPLRLMDRSPPGSSVHGLIQARTLERVAISFSSWIIWQLCPYSSPQRLHRFTFPPTVEEGSLSPRLRGEGISEMSSHSHHQFHHSTLCQEMRTWKVKSKSKGGGSPFFLCTFMSFFPRPPYTAIREPTRTFGGRLRTYQMCLKLRMGPGWKLSTQPRILLKFSDVLCLIFFFCPMSSTLVESGWEWPFGPCDALGKIGRADSTLEKCPKGGQRGAMSDDHQQRAEAPEGAVSSPRRLEAQGGVTSQGRQGRSWGDSIGMLRELSGGHIEGGSLLIISKTEVEPV